MRNPPGDRPHGSKSALTATERLCPNGHQATGNEAYCRACGVAFASTAVWSALDAATDTSAICPNGHHSMADSRFCRTCGIELTHAPAAPWPPGTPLPPPTGPVIDLPPPTDSKEAQSWAPEAPDVHIERAEPAAEPRRPPSGPAIVAVETSRDTSDSQEGYSKSGAPRQAPEEPARWPELREMSPSQNKNGTWRRSWIPITVGLVAVLSVGLFAFAFNRDKKPIACESGAKWQQRPTSRIDGTVLSNGAAEAGIVWGGALIGFPSQQEAAAMGHTNDFVVVSNAEYHSIDSVPREGLLFRERSIPRQPGRYYYSGGGAVYEVANPTTVRALGITPSNAIAIPINGLDSARRIPPTGTLLRLSGRRTTWVIDGGGRRRTESVCDGARTVILPGDPRVLGGIPTIPG